MKKISGLSSMMIGLLTVSVLSAQGVRDDSIPLKNWDAPMYWQPSAVESQDAAAKQLLAGNAGGDRASSITPQAQTPANSLVFVGMTPCRIVDTRTGSGFTGPFGPPSLIGGVSRTFPIQSSTTCSIPSIAQAYSFNITVVPNGFLDFVTVWPTGQPRPLASTLNGYVNTVIANAAILPAGTSGSVDVYASQNTNLIIDINGYYAQQGGITLTQGTAGAPSLSFAGDPGTGIFSSGTGALNVATGGTNRLSVSSNGNVGIGTTTPSQSLQVDGITSMGPPGSVYGFLVPGGSPGPYPTLGFNAYGSTYLSGVAGYGGLFQFQNGDGKLFYYTGTIVSPGAPHIWTPRFVIDAGGHVGIGTVPNGDSLLQVGPGPDFGVYAYGAGDAGLVGDATSGWGVWGKANSGDGVHGTSSSGSGVYGQSSTGFAGYFEGKMKVTSVPSSGLSSTPVCVTQLGDIVTCSSSLRFKTNVHPFLGGLDIIRRLRPVHFNWKEDGKPDIGLGAEDVARVAPAFVIKDSNDEITGVKYDRLNIVLINAVKEQEAQLENQERRITEQQEQLEQQRRQMDNLKELVCLDHPEAAVCK